MMRPVSSSRPSDRRTGARDPRIGASGDDLRGAVLAYRERLRSPVTALVFALGALAPAVAAASPYAFHPLTPKTAKDDEGSTEVVSADPIEQPPAPDAAPPPVADEPPADDEGDVRVVHVHSRGDGRTASSRRIGPAALSTTPKRSAEDLLRLVPGLFIVNHGNQGKGYQFYVRGFDAVHGSDIELRLDDIPLNEPSNIHAHGYLDLAFVIPEVVREIEADKGAFRLDQGNFATAASIRYRLGVPKAQRGVRVGYEVGSTNRHRAVFVAAPKRASEATFVAGEAMYDRGYGENRQARRASAMAQARLFEKDGISLDALGTAYTADFGLPGTIRLDDLKADRIGFYDSYAEGTRGASSRAIAALRLARQTDASKLRVTAWGQGRRLDLVENYTGDLLYPGIGDRHRQHEDRGAVGVELDYEHRLGERTSLRIVGNWRGDAIDQREDRLRADDTIWAGARDLRIMQQTFGVSPGLRFAPRPWALLEAGLRFDAFDYHMYDRILRKDFDGTLVQMSPRATTRFTIRERWQLFAAYGRGFRSPEARAFTQPPSPPENTDLDVYAGGKPALTTTDNVEVGARFEPNDLFDVGMSLYGIWIARESLFDHVSGINVELGGTRRLGLEADLQVHPTKWFDLGLDVTAVHARFVDGGKVPGAPPVFVQLQSSLTHPKGFRAGLRWFLLGPRPLTYGAQAGLLTVVDLSLGYRAKFWQLDLIVDNVINLRWREAEYNFASHWDPDRRVSQIPEIQYVAGPPAMIRVAGSVFF
jgi:outer membrane receptor protein involved in Fe transport